AFGQIISGKRARRSLQILQPGGELWPYNRAIACELSGRNLRVEPVKRMDANGFESLAVEVEVVEDSPFGRFDEKLTLRPVNSDRFIEVPVSGEVVPGVQAYPRVIYVGEVGTTLPIQRTVIIRSNEGKPVGPIRRVSAPAGVIVQEVGDT